MTTAAPRTLRIASRASALAMWQAHYTAGLIRTVSPDTPVEIVEVSTLGDRDRTGPLSAFGGMGVFTREVQKVVLDGQADLAVHSLKDLPTQQVDGLALAGVPVRAPRFDALIFPAGSDRQELADLHQGARIGTGSLRRQAQLKHARPDLVMSEIRGNVDTRLKKLDAGEFDAIVLAAAGLTRLEWSERISSILQPPLMFPAVGQAALGIECRADDSLTINILERLSDPLTKAEVLAERACLNALRAGCHAPVGVLSHVEQDTLSLTGVVLSPDGQLRYEETVTGTVTEALNLGTALAEQLLLAGAAAILHAS